MPPEAPGPWKGGTAHHPASHSSGKAVLGSGAPTTLDQLDGQDEARCREENVVSGWLCLWAVVESPAVLSHLLLGPETGTVLVSEHLADV